MRPAISPDGKYMYHAVSGEHGGLHQTNLKTGNPKEANIFLTCLFFPSVNSIRAHDVGIFFLNLTGGSLSGNTGAFGNFLT